MKYLEVDGIKYYRPINDYAPTYIFGFKEDLGVDCPNGEDHKHDYCSSVCGWTCQPHATVDLDYWIKKGRIVLHK